MAAGKGSIRLKREPDYWEVRAYAGRDPTTGRQRYVSRSVRGGKRDAQRRLTELTHELQTHGPTTRRTVTELVTSHIDHLETRGREARTIEAYRSIARAIAEDPLGAVQVDRLSVKAVDDYYTRLSASGLAPNTVGRYHAVLRAACKQAMAWGWMARNPVTLATPPSPPRIQRKIVSAEVVSKLLDEAARSRNPENLVAFRLLAATGARRGEVCGLRWDSVDLDKNRIEIRAAMAQLMTGEVREKDPKSHQIREVQIDPTTAQILKEHHESQQALATQLDGELAVDAFVLADLASDPNGSVPTHPNRLTQAFSRIRTRVPGAEQMRLHDLRHWFASTQLDAGEPLPAVAARIGDHVETLAKVYAHKGTRGDQDAANQIGGLLDG